MGEFSFFFGIASFICLGIVTVLNIFTEGKYSSPKGLPSVIAICFGMMLLSYCYEDGIRFNMSFTDDPSFQLMGNFVFLFVFLPLLSLVIYFSAYMAVRITFSMMVYRTQTSKSIDYFLAPIVFIIVNSYVYQNI